MPFLAGCQEPLRACPLENVIIFIEDSLVGAQIFHFGNDASRIDTIIIGYSAFIGVEEGNCSGDFWKDDQNIFA